MALEGNLSAFGLSEILQLIAVQQKTGMLTVSKRDNTAVIFFREGLIISTRDRRRRAKDPFKEYLTRYGVLTRKELIKITQIGSQSKLDLLDILGSEDFLSDEDLKKHYVKQVQETLHDVLTWDNCSYKFVSNYDVVKGINSVGEFSIEAMLMESMRRIDEFPQMLEMFPNDRILVTRVDASDGPDNSEKTTNEKAVLELLKDIMPLRDVIARAKMPLFEVYESLKLLQDKNLIKTRTDETDAENEAAIDPAMKAPAKRRRNPLFFIVVSIVFSATVCFGINGFVQNLGYKRAAVIESIESNSTARNQIEENLRWLIEAYRAQYGTYPLSLSSLEETGFASLRLIKISDAFSFRYQLTSDRSAYTLL